MYLKASPLLSQECTTRCCPAWIQQETVWFSVGTRKFQQDKEGAVKGNRLITAKPEEQESKSLHSVKMSYISKYIMTWKSLKERNKGTPDGSLKTCKKSVSQSISSVSSFLKIRNQLHKKQLKTKVNMENEVTCPRLCSLSITILTIVS